MIRPRFALLLLPILLFKLAASAPLPQPTWALSPSGVSPSSLEDRSGPPAEPVADILDDMYGEYSFVHDLS
ncbi:hypothetical protein CF328_g6040 [Tilletia controversa]|nr:hypothetical protein CF328_g6040 [Tilletia controversa]